MVNKRWHPSQMRNNLKQIREEKGLTQEQLADAMGVHYTTINRIENKPTLAPKWVKRFAEYFKVPESRLVGMEPDTESGKRFLPVFGLAAGAVRGTHRMDSDPVEYLPAPPALAHVRDAYALIVTGNSMEPRYASGEVIFLHPHRPCRNGDHVVIQELIDGGITVSIKQLDKLTDEHVVTRQYNPPAEVKFLRSRVQAMHRVLTTNELFGV
ncbi:MAG: helix-turn-helix transcriptional regulator [Nitratireductor sp.]|nr:helix-turn-helix transcriptional regulator [Nitratireductor sp.]